MIQLSRFEIFLSLICVEVKITQTLNLQHVSPFPLYSLHPTKLSSTDIPKQYSYFFAKIHPPVQRNCIQKAHQQSSYSYKEDTHRRNRSRKCKHTHTRSHDPPPPPLNQRPRSHRSKQRCCGHRTIKQCERLRVRASWAKDTGVCSFFVFDDGGEISCDGGDDEDERKATTDKEDAEKNFLFPRVMVD